MQKLIINGQNVSNGFNYSQILNPYGNFFILIGESLKTYNSFTLRDGKKTYSYIDLIDENFKIKYNLKDKNDK